jgi:radical SAM family protein
VRILLLSTYELGRQPFGLASPAAWLRSAGFDVAVADLSRTRLDREEVAAAQLVGIFLPMHTATRLALPVLERLREINPAAHICAYGLYAPANAELLRARGVGTVLGGEFEADLVGVAESIRSGDASPPDVDGDSPRRDIPGTVPIRTRTRDIPGTVPIRTRTRDMPGTVPIRAVPRLKLMAPDRRGLPPLDKYASLVWPDGTSRITGYTEASRGCKHLCRHCPVVPVYGGRFRVVDPDVVMEDVRAQVAAGAQHITFGDPDFWNGIGHARRVVAAFAREFPDLTYDVTIKIEHLRDHREHLPELRDTGCAFVTSAVESVDDGLLAKLEKGHTCADFELVAGEMRAVGLPLIPTFVAFTPWTSLQHYSDLIATVDRLGLIEHVSPVQWSIRLLIPRGSRLLELDDVRALVEEFDPVALAYPWRHADARMDALQQRVARIVGQANGTPRLEIAGAILEAIRAADSSVRVPRLESAPAAGVPHVTEPWYCCAEPTEGQTALL